MELIALPNQTDLTLEYDDTNQEEFGPCPDCGQKTKRVWGFVHRGDVAIAIYYVEWTPAHQEKEAAFDLIIGKWGEDASAADRRAVSLGYKVLESGPAFMVQDASRRRIAQSPLICEALDRGAVLGTPTADHVFEICDLIYLADPRIAELRPAAPKL